MLRIKSGLILSLLFSTIYLATIPDTNVSFADSDLMTSIGYFGGVAHPPGYPLYMLLLYIFTHLPILVSVAFKAHLLSLVLHTLTLFFVYNSIWVLIDYLQNKYETLLFSRSLDKLLISLLSTSYLGFSFLFWTYSIVAEKYALNDLFAAIIIFLSFKILFVKKTSTHLKNWFMLAFVCGLSIMHHQTIVLLWPSVFILAYWKWSTIKKNIFRLVSYFLLATMLSIGLLFVLNQQQVPISWHFTPTISGFIDEITRKDLTGTTMDGSVRSMYLSNFRLSSLLSKTPELIQLFIHYFGFIPILLFIFGLLNLTKLDKKLFLYLISLVIFTTFFIPLYLDWPPTLADQSLKVRMYLLAQIPIPLIISLGLYQLFRLIKSYQSKSSSVVSVGVALSLTLLITNRVLSLYPLVDLSQFDFTHRYYSSILNQAPPNSLLVCMSDVSCFALLYLHQVENLRPDIVLVPTVENVVTQSLDTLPNLHGFNYTNEPHVTLDYITWNLSQRPVIVVDLQKQYFDALGMNYGFVKYIPQGYSGLIQYQSTIPVSYSYVFSDQLISSQFAPFDHMRQQLQAAMAQQHLLNAQSRLRLGDSYDTVYLEEIEFAHKLSRNLPITYTQAINNSTRWLIDINRFDVYGDLSEYSKEKLTTAADKYLFENKMSLAYIGYKGALNLDPKYNPARFKLASLYQMVGDKINANLEYQNAQKYP